jgi:hypothetical protein
LSVEERKNTHKKNKRMQQRTIQNTTNLNYVAPGGLELFTLFKKNVSLWGELLNPDGILLLTEIVYV